MTPPQGLRRRRPLFAANWKMYKSPDEARAFVDAFIGPARELVASADIALLAPYTDMEALRSALAGSTIAYGAQDCYWEPEGAYTGAISAAMLRALGATYCIVGHSERRRLFGETDDTVALKVNALLKEGVTPIVCVGETLEAHQAGRTRERVAQQIQAGLGHLTDAERTALVVAYEPVWAIGTGLADEPQDANATIAYIRTLAGGLAEARILYGGSMKPANSAALCAQPNIDGGLVGSASLDPAGFITLISNGLAVIDQI